MFLFLADIALHRPIERRNIDPGRKSHGQLQARGRYTNPLQGIMIVAD